MTDKEHFISIKPYLPGLVDQALRVRITDFNNDAGDEAIKVWMLAKMFPDALAGDLLGVVTGENTFSFSDDGLTATIHLPKEKAK